jgi:hypothetical protein
MSKKIIAVDDRFRTNKLSLKPGGSTVVVRYKDGHEREYDKIKNTKAYIRNIEKGNSVVSACVKH